MYSLSSRFTRSLTDQLVKNLSFADTTSDHRCLAASGDGVICVVIFGVWPHLRDIYCEILIINIDCYPEISDRYPPSRFLLIRTISRKKWLTTSVPRTSQLIHSVSIFRVAFIASFRGLKKFFCVNRDKCEQNKNESAKIVLVAVVMTQHNVSKSLVKFLIWPLKFCQLSYRVARGSSLRGCMHWDTGPAPSIGPRFGSWRDGHWT